MTRTVCNHGYLTVVMRVCDILAMVYLSIIDGGISGRSTTYDYLVLTAGLGKHRESPLNWKVLRLSSLCGCT